MSRLLRHRLAAFRRCSRGLSSVEFALAAPVLIMAVVGIMEIGMIFFASTLLEGGLREAARFGITGTSPTLGSREDRIVEIVNEHGIGLIAITAADIEINVYQDFDSVGEPEPYADEDTNGEYDLGEPYTDINCNGQWDEDRAVSGAGAGGDVVHYSIDYDWPLLFGMLGPIVGDNGKVALNASVAVRNEPFSDGTPTC